jgi:hypothetical protein
MASVSFTEEDRLFPVHCPRCRVHIPGEQSKNQTYCDKCLAEIAKAVVTPSKPVAPSPPADAPAFVDAADAPKRRFKLSKKAAAVCGAALVLALMAAAVMAFISAKQNAVRSAKIQAAIGKLKSAHPGLEFAPYNGSHDFVNLNADFESLRLVSAQLDRAGGELWVKVRLFGSAGKAVAPELNLTVYDDKGAQIAQGDLVRHVLPDLYADDYQEDTEMLPVPENSSPAIVAFDDNAVAREERRTVSQAPPRAITEPAAPAPQPSQPTTDPLRGPRPSVSGGYVPAVESYLLTNYPTFDRKKTIATPVDAGPDCWIQEVAIVYGDAQQPSEKRLRFSIRYDRIVNTVEIKGEQ